MPLFISNFEPVRHRSPRRWLLVFAAAVLLAGSLVVTYEQAWRSRGYRPVIQDTMQNWALERARIYPRGRQALVFAGASRTLYGIDLPWVRDNLPHYRPVMLAINGHYPLALLRDLAEDEKFSGIVLLDVESRGLNAGNHAMQQPYIDFYHQELTPARKMHQHLLRHLQRAFVFMSSDFSLEKSVLRRLGKQPAPAIPNGHVEIDRNGRLDLQVGNPAALADWFYQLVTEDAAINPPPDPGQWLADLNPVVEWVESIEARGGGVIFYSPPTAGRQVELEAQFYPREVYWDRFLATYALSGLRADDLPGMAEFEQPDESHIDWRDKARYTRLLFAELRARGYLR